MSHNTSPPDQQDRKRGEPTSSNHLIWGMTAGLLLGTALGFIVLDNAGVGVAVGIVLGAVFATALRGRVP